MHLLIKQLMIIYVDQIGIECSIEAKQLKSMRLNREKINCNRLHKQRSLSHTKSHRHIYITNTIHAHMHTTTFV